LGEQDASSSGQGQAGGGANIAILRLTLSDFRSYAHLRLETDSRPVVLFGLNGAGKTNILEALSFLAPGRGLRRAKLSDVARQAAGEGAPWAVAATLRRDRDLVEIGTGREVGSERRGVRIDGQTAKGQGALADLLSALWLTPVMDRLFVEGAGGRRRFLDRLVYGFDAAHGSRATTYEHAMRERTRLLKAGRADPSWLAALEATMAERGTAMALARRRVVQDLNEACRQGIGPFPAAELVVAGSVEDWLAEDSPQEAEQKFLALLRNGRRRDEAAGAATEGPHRSDLRVRHLTREMAAEFCSTGEQKALLISVVLAQARVRAARLGSAPMLLLDEVAAHLDEVRRAALYDELCALGAQSWLTGTDAGLFEAFGERAQKFAVKDGVLSAFG